MEFSGFNSIIYNQRIQNLKTAAIEYLKDPLSNPVIEEWVGMRPMCFDDLPIIDVVPGKKNLFIASGHGMVGLSMATGTGKLVADMVNGIKPCIDPSPFSLKRF